MDQNRLVSLRRLVLRTILLLITISLVFEFIIGFLLKEEALTDLAREEARHTSELIFENLYTKMQEGWSKDDIEKILLRLNGLRQGMQINLYRSRIVEKKYGVIEKDRQVIARDPLVAQAIQGKEEIHISYDHAFRYLYPIRVGKKCLKCHDNARVGDINGVLDIRFPAHQIVVSLDRMIFYFIASLTLFLGFFFFFFYWLFNRRLILPLLQFIREVEKTDIDSGTLNEVKVLQRSECQDLRTLESTFNTLIRKIRFYYQRLIDSFLIDPLTGLKNMNRLKADLEAKSGPVSMMLINVDRFKELNDYYGFEMGDRVLVHIAKILSNITEHGCEVYRVGGSEFALVREDDFAVEEILEHLAQLHNFTFEEKELEGLRITMTAGVVQQQKKRLIEKASIALNAAKERNKPFEFYRNAKDVEVGYKRHTRWMREVSEAIEENRIVLYYQPIQSLKEPTLKKYEVLVRVIDRDGVIHLPGEFLDVVQHSRLYTKLTRVVLEKSFERFRQSGCAFSVNLSINDIEDPFCRKIIYEYLHRFSRPELVTFEILESEEVSDFSLVNEFIQMVHSLGGSIAIDDFGSGYSNFHYLPKMKVDYFKIDASLIRHIHKDADIRMLVESIVSFARKMGVETVAEFVENEEIAKVCEAIGFDYLQGYYIGHPGPFLEGC